MKLFITSYIGNLLRQANYEYDEETKSWCASVDSLPGAYAQADSVEEVREELASVIEDYIILTLKEGRELPNFTREFAHV